MTECVIMYGTHVCEQSDKLLYLPRVKLRSAPKIGLMETVLDFYNV